jgi:hypothetical protein
MPTIPTGTSHFFHFSSRAGGVGGAVDAVGFAAVGSAGGGFGRETGSAATGSDWDAGAAGGGATSEVTDAVAVEVPGAMTDTLTGVASAGAAGSDGGGTVTVTVMVNGEAVLGVAEVVMGRSRLV